MLREGVYTDSTSSEGSVWVKRTALLYGSTFH